MKNLVISRFHSFQQIPVIIVVAITMLAWMGGCKTTTSPGMTGSFAGMVMLSDTTGIIADFSGTTVSIDGTSFITSTNSIGQWIISGVPEGQYNITASKPGFGTFHWYEQQLLNGTLNLQPAELARLKSFTPKLSYAGWGSGALNFNVQITSDSMQNMVGYCDIDSTTQPSAPHFATANYVYWGNGGLGSFSYEVLREAGAQSGQTLYVSASVVGGGSFFDPAHNETRWASTGPKSNVIAVTMP